jgi:hypothetical protein
MAMMRALEPECACAICVAMRSLWYDTVATVAEHYHLDDAEAEQHVRTYAPSIPRMTQ